MQGMLHEKKTKEGPEEEEGVMWKKKVKFGETRSGKDLFSLLLQGLTKEQRQK